MATRFLMEHVANEEVYNKWMRYCQLELDLWDRWSSYTQPTFPGLISPARARELKSDARLDTLIRSISDPIDKFKRKCLACWKDAEVWVAYVIHEKDKVEICMCVVTSPGLPVVVHMGIFRSIRYLLEHFDKRTTGLAMQLHAFAATFMFLRGKRFMVTAPLKSMLDIFKSAVPADQMQAGTDRRWLFGNRDQGFRIEDDREKLNMRIDNQRDSWFNFVIPELPSNTSIVVMRLEGLAHLWKGPRPIMISTKHVAVSVLQG